MLHLQPALNTDLLTDRYDTKRWWHAFGTDAEDMLTEPLGRLIGSYRDMELRSSHIFGGGVYFYTQLLNSPLRVCPARGCLLCYHVRRVSCSIQRLHAQQPPARTAVLAAQWVPVPRQQGIPSPAGLSVF